jgi:hypothetical protein
MWILFKIINIYNKKTMKKNVLNEIKEMKYLFGYKPGKVISEQDLPEQDYEMEDDISFYDDEIFGQDHLKVSLYIKQLKISLWQDTTKDETNKTQRPNPIISRLISGCCGILNLAR